ncbi:MAG: hypothetical protein HeimC3_27820 [Candidatus Heimdallarchaeota archaeon LC_3]|nr:MAG: hypothetical protein HeimC3_27820 [Candidatus Heimdallarchaeota archaeon LC_3]
MQEDKNTKDETVSLINVEIKSGSISKDLSLILLKILLILLIIPLISSVDFLIMLIIIFVLAYLFSSTFRDGYSIFHYYKGAKFVNGVYLNKTKPVCPFLLVTPSGFKCQSEFKIPFSMSDDFPRCHNESLFKAHWNEKAPGILEQARNESSLLKIRSFIASLTRIEYKESADFYLEIISAPKYSIVHNWIVDAFTDSIEISKENLLNKVKTKFEEQKIKNPGLEEVDVITLFDRTLEYFLKTGAIFEENNELLKIISYEDLKRRSKSMKTRDHVLVKNGALLGLSTLKDLRALPLIFDSLGKDSNNDRNLVNVIATYQEDAVEPLKELINANIENDAEDKVLLAIEALGLMERNDNYDFLYDFWTKNKQEDDDLLQSYLLSALFKSKPFESEDLVLEILLTSNIENLAYDTSRRIVLDNSKQFIKIMSDKLIALPDGELTEDQEDVREVCIIMLEDFEPKQLENWLSHQTQDYVQNFITVLKREGLKDLILRLNLINDT